MTKASQVLGSGMQLAPSAPKAKAESKPEPAKKAAKKAPAKKAATKKKAASSKSS